MSPRRSRRRAGTGLDRAQRAPRYLLPRAAPTEIPRALRGLARELRIPIVATAKLSRTVEDRADFRPRLVDLSRVGAVEREADVLLLLHRAAYYLTPEEAYEQGVTNRVELIVSKNRHGPTGAIELELRRDQGWLGDLSR